MNEDCGKRRVRLDGSANITDEGLRLVELAPDVTEDEVRKQTEPEILTR